MAPMLPFLSEKIFETLNLRDLTKLPSVHMELYPKAQPLEKEESALLLTMEATRQVVSEALGIRVLHNLKIRQPLNRLYIDSDTKLFDDLIVDEINIKSVQKGKPEITETGNFINSSKIWLETTVTEDLRLEGIAREMIRKIQDLRKEYNLSVKDKVTVTYLDHSDNKKAVQKFGEDIKQKVLAASLTPGTRYEVIKV